jgi:bifunctional UDP-N-acetylglucosamine pyrophosphorylase/glucosamine-1-phosphate N-acetyltransferase
VSGAVAVILAAGHGTRMRSAIPKLAHELCGRPLLAWPIAAARAAGIERIVVVDGPERRLSELARRHEHVEVVIQPQQRGTADAVRAAATQLHGARTAIVLNGDLPLLSAHTLTRLARRHEEQGAAATMLTAVLEDPSGYGRVVRAPDGTVERVVETKLGGDADEGELHIREVNAGVFAFEVEALLRALEQVGSDNAQGEQYLPDVLPVMRQLERTVLALELEDPVESLQVNDRRQLASVRAIAQQRILERHMLAGVTIVDPAASVVDVEVEIGQDSVVAPYTSLHGSTRIGRGCTVGPHATLIDAEVADGARIVHSYVREARIGERVSVGPFAYLRPGTVMRAGSKAGTFVEIKGSDVGAGAKVPHLSYVGDAEIGEGTNLGAATITANYDGRRKHRTRIGAHVRTGVDTTLVAPVDVGDGAYTGAGSVITKDVPPGALGIARSRQTNIEGYAERRRERDAEPQAYGEREGEDARRPDARGEREGEDARRPDARGEREGEDARRPDARSRGEGQPERRSEVRR